MADWRGNCNILWIAINSSYYFGTNANRLMIAGDIAGFVNHMFTNNTSIADVPELLVSTTQIEVSNYHCDMHISDASDVFLHTSRSMCDIILHQDPVSHLLFESVAFSPMGETIHAWNIFRIVESNLSI